MVREKGSMCPQIPALLFSDVAIRAEEAMNMFDTIDVQPIQHASPASIPLSPSSPPPPPPTSFSSPLHSPASSRFTWLSSPSPLVIDLTTDNPIIDLTNEPSIMIDLTMDDSTDDEDMDSIDLFFTTSSTRTSVPYLLEELPLHTRDSRFYNNTINTPTRVYGDFETALTIHNRVDFFNFEE